MEEIKYEPWFLESPLSWRPEPRPWGRRRSESEVGVHINPLGDLIVWVNGEQADGGQEEVGLLFKEV